MNNREKSSERKQSYIGGSIILLLYFGDMYVFPLIPEYFIKSQTLLEIATILLSLVLFGLMLAVNKFFDLKLFEKSKFKWWYLLLILGFVALNFSKGLLLEPLFNPTESTANGEKLVETSMATSMIYFFVSTSILAPVMEEIVYRGVILQTFFKQHLWIGLFVSSIAFAFAHHVTDLYSFFNYFVPGLLFGLICLITKDLRYCVAGHILNNSLPVIFLLLMMAYKLV